MIGSSVFKSKPKTVKYQKLEREIMSERRVLVTQLFKELKVNEGRVEEAKKALEKEETRKEYGAENLERYLKQAQENVTKCHQSLEEQGFENIEAVETWLKSREIS